MPSKNIIKTYVENGYYHIYNRGVEKRKIFFDNQDYSTFLYYLKTYLSPPETLPSNLRNHLKAKNLSKEIDLLAYCLMPNHFHLLVKQNSKDAITKLMRQLTTGYVMYFNRRNKRIGPLFQSRFKAVIVDNDEYLLHLSRYIHHNPLNRTSSLKNFEWSSYGYYLGSKEETWLKPKTVLQFFNNSNKKLSYQDFTEAPLANIRQLTSTPEIPENLLLDYA